MLSLGVIPQPSCVSLRVVDPECWAERNKEWQGAAGNFSGHQVLSHMGGTAARTVLQASPLDGGGAGRRVVMGSPESPAGVLPKSGKLWARAEKRVLPLLHAGKLRLVLYPLGLSLDPQGCRYGEGRGTSVASWVQTGSKGTRFR